MRAFFIINRDVCGQISEILMYVYHIESEVGENELVKVTSNPHPR